MVHNEHFRKADESYEVWHDNNGNAVHMYIKDGEVILFPTLWCMVNYLTTGDNNIERTYFDEDRLSEIPDAMHYNYYSIRDWISASVLEDTFVTALEGGSNYWVYISPTDIKEMQIPGEPTSECILKAVLGGREVDVYDIEGHDLDNPIGKLSIRTMSHRLSLLMNSEPHKHALIKMMRGDYDAIDADIVFQYLALGEVIYG